MARVGRFLGWGACLLAAAVFAAYAFGPIDALPGMRLGGTPTDAPANWIDVNDHDDIFIETAGFPPLNKWGRSKNKWGRSKIYSWLT